MTGLFAWISLTALSRTYLIYIIIPSAHQGIMSNNEEKTLKLWCNEDMVRAVALVNEGMVTSEAAQVYSVSGSTFSCIIYKGYYPQLYNAYMYAI